ncbi:MAG: bis(5'-nucleosyl)-tetraphosphatase (symmetrical) YqeK [Clostridia bacterium]|nr:bis(5'-nucleosyl)-tetraphosphatase (symmetrical) YqeK [Clostridia bacterium]
MKLEEIQKYVKEHLSEKRYYHSMCVMERSEELAIKYGADIERVKKIGIAHDIAKEMTEQEKLEYVNKNNIKIDETEKENVGLLHAKIGKDIAKKQFGFPDYMGQAIENHTTGNKNMDIYSKILFIADRTSKDRNFEDIKELNKLVDENINEAVLYILDKKIELQIKKKATIHINGIMARNYLLKNK